MIHAELAGKLTETQRLSTASRWEDVLTSAVFGLLRYLPPTVTTNCLRQAVSPSGSHLSIADWTSERSIEYFFWPSLPRWRREPDVVIDFRSASRRLERRVIVEAKYLSGKTLGPTLPDVISDLPSDQLADELTAAWDDHIQGRVVGDELPALVYLTAHYVFPDEDISGSLSRLPGRANDVKPHLYWLSWWQMGEVLGRFLKESTDRAHVLIVQDLLRLLDARGQVALSDAWRTPPPSVGPRWIFGVKSTVWWMTPIPAYHARWRFEKGIP